MTSYSKLIGTGSYLPEKIVTNQDLSKIVDTTDEWIVTRTGIRERRVGADQETSLSMAEIAARRAIEAANISPKQLGLIAVTTVNPEKFFPSTACMLQARLGASTQCTSFDINAACSGFIYALTIVDCMVRSSIDYALIVCSEKMTQLVDWTDRNTCVLFGDAAAAVVLTRDSAPGLINSHLYSDGSYADLLYMDTGLYGKNWDKRIHMNGREVFKIAVAEMAKSVKHMLDDSQFSVDQIDWMIPHQANLRIIDAMVEKLHFPKEKVIMTIEKYANTSSATIPVALDIAIRDGRIRRGQTLLFEAFGAGLTWGSVLFKY